MINEILFLILAFITSIISATVGLGSAIILIPFSTFLLPIKKAIAIITIYFIALNISKITIYSKFDLISQSDIPLILGLILCAFGGSYIGKKFVKKIHPQLFKKIILTILLIVSLKLLFF